MDVLDWLSRWYEAQCNGDWEHAFGPRIDTIDNPGWSFKVDLAGTDCDGRVLDRITHNYEHETDWWTCWTEGNAFHGAGGPLHLRSLLEAFRDWATNVRHWATAELPLLGGAYALPDGRSWRSADMHAAHCSALVAERTWGRSTGSAAPTAK